MTSGGTLRLSSRQAARFSPQQGPYFPAWPDVLRLMPLITTCGRRSSGRFRTSPDNATGSDATWRAYAERYLRTYRGARRTKA
jgi:hypothetical protein